MEPVIAVLPAHVVDQIAAGEVIERPASVVKELVDNAIDAGARAITVEVAAGGRTLVRVTDDGCGMSARDAVLAFEPHATSKLRVVDDLWNITSMGFRGEALPSIASVARVTLTTRRECDLAATRVVIEGSKLISATEVGAPVGTTVEVADLLFNVPARLKFLKGEATEASHITDWMAKVALGHPHLHLRLKHRAAGGTSRTALELPPDRDGFARVQAVLGARIASRMIPIDGTEGGVRVTAYLGAPELVQATARNVQLFVGKRAVRDRGVLHALAMGYGELVPRGRYPVAVMMLELAPGTVDINVHPQKSEVRFSDPSAVAAAVRHVVQAGVTAAQWRADSAASTISMTAIASTAPPALPFDGPATSMAQRYARELRSRASIGSIGRRRSEEAQPSLGIEPRTDARSWAREVQRESHGLRAAENRGLSKFTRTLRDSSKPDPMAAIAAAYSAAVGNPEQTAMAAAIARAGIASGEAAMAAAISRAGGDASAIAAAIEAAAGDPAAMAAAIARVGGDPGSVADAIAGATSSPTTNARLGSGALLAAEAAMAAAITQAGGDAAAISAAIEDAGGDPVAMAATVARFGGDPTAVAAAIAGAGPSSSSQGGDPSRTALALDNGIVGSDSDSAWSRNLEPAAAKLAEGSGRVAERGYFAQLRYLGQLDLTYFVCEAMGELVLVDQHAAHERVELARLIARHSAHEPAIQKLLFPLTLDATPAQLELVGRMGPLLAQVGYEAEVFGKATIALKAVPAGIRHGDPAQLLRSLLDDWAKDGAPSDEERLIDVLSKIACHSVVRAGDRLAPSEAEALLASLDGVDPSVPTPHGRSLLLRFPISEIGRRFGR